MPATDVPGLAEIIAWAKFLNIEISQTLDKMGKLMQTDPTSIWAGSDQLGTVASGLGTGQENAGKAGANVLATGMAGRTADSFGTVMPTMLDQVAGAGTAAQQLATKLDGMATAFAQSQHTVMSATGATATALGMLRAAQP